MRATSAPAVPLPLTDAGLTAAKIADFYAANSLFHCPAAKFPANAATDINAYFSLAMNSKLIEGAAKTIKTSTILQPTITVFFLENRLKGENRVTTAQPDDTDKDLGQPASYANRFAARHGQNGNLTFADGHSAAAKGSKIVDLSTGKAVLPQTEICWTTDPSVSP